MTNPYSLQARHEQAIELQEGDCPLAFTRSDFVRYAGPDQIIASALMFQMLTRAFAELSRGEPPERNDVEVQVGFPGPGVTDILELVLRGSTRNAANITVKTEELPLEAPEALIGRFYYEFAYGGRRIALWPVDGYFTEEFRNQVIRFQPRVGSKVEQDGYQAFKHDLVTRLMAASPDKLFHMREVA